MIPFICGWQTIRRSSTSFTINIYILRETRWVTVEYQEAICYFFLELRLQLRYNRSNKQFLIKKKMDLLK